MVRPESPLHLVDDNATGTDESTPELGRRGQDIAAVLWPSFLVACAATMVVFALFDPTDLAAIVSLDISFAPMTGYAAGFFLLWTFCAASSYVTLFMVRTAHRAKRIRRGNEGKR